jgi:hypothetical protein
MASGEHPEEGCEGGNLANRAHEGCDWCGRTLVHIGCPGVEWHERHFEGKADEQHCNTGKEQCAVVAGVLAGKRGADGGEIGAAGAAEHEGDAIQEEGRRETAEDEVFEARFPALCAVAVASHKQIKREAEDFEAEEQHDEVVGLRHHDAADSASQDKCIDLGAVFIFAFEIIVGD